MDRINHFMKDCPNIRSKLKAGSIIHNYVAKRLKLKANHRARQIELNKMLIEFLKETNSVYFKWNHNYKGLHTADVVNSYTIYNYHYSEFKKWINTLTNPKEGGA